MKARISISIALALLVFCAGYAALFIAPDEATMHLIQRIFYFHVPLWTAMTVVLSIACFSNIAWLVSRRPMWDLLGASSEIGRAQSELQSPVHLVCRLLLEKKKTK